MHTVTSEKIEQMHDPMKIPAAAVLLSIDGTSSVKAVLDIVNFQKLFTFTQV